MSWTTELEEERTWWRDKGPAGCLARGKSSSVGRAKGYRGRGVKWVPEKAGF